MASLQYPIGKPETVTPTKIAQWIDYLTAFPQIFRAIAESLSAAQLD